MFHCCLNISIFSLPTEELNLLEILKQPAFTIEEKLHVLEARDKLIRLCNKKQPNLLKLERTIGTCPDMCPEKERLLREVQHQVNYVLFIFKLSEVQKYVITLVISALLFELITGQRPLM